MIAKLTGKIDELKPTELILDVGGVGYELRIPFTTYEKIQHEKKITLYVYTLHKEDRLELYGFSTEEDKRIFTILLNISGIGPSMGLSLLSGISIERLVDSVKTDNTALLVKIPGIGKSKAEKLIFELKRKIKKLEEFAGTTSEKTSPGNDAVEALVSLGFDEAKAYTIVGDILKKNPEGAIEFVIKEALKFLSA
ncbi:MAG: Holliday junction branch migration protein RuvA [bacterium]|nr:Holliday junction branch migration protein RuvA [bacterium]